MHRLAAGRLGGCDDARDVEVARGRRRRADADCAVREPDVKGVLVDRRVHGDALDPELAAGPDHADGDLAPVGDEDPLEHGTGPGSDRVERAGARRLELEQELPVLHGRCVLDADRPHDGVCLGLDLVHELHRLENAERLPALDRVAHLDERRRARLGRAVERADHR